MSVNDLNATWEAIESWYAGQGASHLLSPGTGEEAITAAEQSFGVRFPEVLRASLRRHDGSGEGGWPTGTLLSLARMADERGIWMDLLQDGTFDPNASHIASPKSEIQPGWWNPGWIPIDADGGGNGAVMDLNPGPQGQSGQLLYMDHEVGPEGPTFPDFTAYLQDALKQLQSGEYVYHQQGGSEGIFAADELG